MDKTYEKIASRFYWPAIDQDIREFIQRCDVCQRTNDAKFTEGEIALHPIRVEPKVCKQVSRFFSSNNYWHFNYAKLT